MAPTVTSSPSRAPARARARSTPSRRSRRTTSACAPSSLRSESATARSAARPWTTQVPEPGPLHGDALRCGSVHDDLARGGRRRLGPGLLHQRGETVHQRADAEPRRGREHHLAHAFVVGTHVALAPHDDPRALQELGPVRAQLGQQDTPLLRGRDTPGLGRTEIQEHHQHTGALDVAQELVPEPLALRRPFDQAGDVGHHELGAVARATDPYDTEMRLERREGVGGDLGLGRRHRRDQRRLAGVGETDQRHVGHQLELHVQPELLPLLALLGEGRGAPAVGEKARVAPAALAALGHHGARAVLVEVADHRATAIPHDRSDRHRHHQVLAPGAVPLGARAVHAVGGAAERVVPEAEQRRLVDRGHEPDVPAVTAVAAVGATPVHVGLPAPRHRPRPPVAGARVQLGLVDEAGHRGKSLRAEQSAGALTHLGAGPVNVDGGAPTHLDDLRPAHPDVGHQVPGTRPHEMAQQLGVARARA